MKLDQRQFVDSSKVFEAMAAEVPGAVAVTVYVRGANGLLGRSTCRQTFDAISRYLSERREEGVFYAADERSDGFVICTIRRPEGDVHPAVVDLLAEFFATRSSDASVGECPELELKVDAKTHVGAGYREQTVLYVSPGHAPSNVEISGLLDAALAWAH